MKKTLIGLGILVLALSAAPLFAQGPFADVPTDHWAYDAVNELQQAGIVIGYPDGTFGGKRAMTRYEFSVAIARMIPIIEERLGGAGPVGPAGPAGPAGPQGPAGTAGVTPEQFNALQALVNEFRDELATLGVDVDALKRDVAALAARVDAIEKEMRRVKITGDLNVFGVATTHDTGSPFDLDSRPLQGTGPAAGELINSVSFIRDMDLKIAGTLSPSVTAFADINFGNYIPAYLGGIVTDYVGTERTVAARSADDQFIPYYMYVEAGLGGGSVQIGRIPVQYTPYTLKLIDVDSYTVNDKLDSGNYPLDGGKLNWKFGGVGINAFAAKTDQNDRLGIGLVSQPTAGLYTISPAPGGAVFHDAGGHSVGGLGRTTQVAGARAVIGTPLKGNLGLTWVEAAGPLALPGYDQARVLGADARINLGRFAVAAEYAQTTTEDDDGVLADIDEDNTALDAKVGFGLGKLGIDLGWRSVENNFAGPGYWTKIGMWTNPTNVEGPYLNLTYGLGPSLSIVANGAFYSGANAVAGLPAVIDSSDDDLWNAKVGLKWGLTSTNSVNLGWERVRWSPDGGGDTDEDYITIGWAHQLNPSAGFNVGYQIIDYSPTGAIAPYGTSDYKGAVAVAQFRAQF